MSSAIYEVYALKYATRPGKRSEHFIGGDGHDGPMPMDYFIWLVRNAERSVVIDTGFSAQTSHKRGRTYLRSPREALALIGEKAEAVKDVVLTHMHFDHAGTLQDFPVANFHVQDDEVQFATGRNMRHGYFRFAFEVEDVCEVVRLVYKDRITFHQGDVQLAPGISLHRIGGHTAGLQCVRVATQRGWLVLASDASHYYENLETCRCFSSVYHAGEMIEGFSTLRRLADSDAHIIPGHDPMVMQRYPGVPGLEDIAVRLDGSLVR